MAQWRLVEGRAFDRSGNPLPSPFGPQPMGIAEFGPERMIAVAGDGRASLPAEVMTRFFVAYGGGYTFDGSELITHVDTASILALIGTDQS